MANILITEALSAKAHKIKSEYAANGVPIIMGDFNDVPVVMLKSGAIKNLPRPDSVAYPHQILTFCLDNNVNTVFVLNEHEINALEPALQLFFEYDIDIQLVKNDL
ncbi:hypothetical protein ACFQZS_09400 [Mucilaginibacter calamicampi]|uniref:Uncharacterized protein n=1 Tax=Mucilaginibacter calamicampi TaxID=1302352 RepID=A0ABW2YXJ9_9SPHI